ncbi:hypothetical protein [Nocardia amikacinitolerans]|uniref:hypothetical protein n=1 Tax=Nocardia amikacinitolerans TaxID=756689 RepID=UPI0020A37FA1|nr:hypothetical protein [Nocardia amikacinitolerans]
MGARVGSNRFAGLLAWEILHAMGHFPKDTPPTLRNFIYRGQRTPEQMVDFYGVRDREIRQLIIDYLVRRQADTDYVTREGPPAQSLGSSGPESKHSRQGTAAR